MICHPFSFCVSAGTVAPVRLPPTLSGSSPWREGRHRDLPGAGLQCRENGIPRLSPCMCVGGDRGWSAKRKEAKRKEEDGLWNLDPPGGNLWTPSMTSWWTTFPAGSWLSMDLLQCRSTPDNSWKIAGLQPDPTPSRATWERQMEGRDDWQPLWLSFR